MARFYVNRCCRPRAVKEIAWSSSPELGTLVEVNLRDAWHHEAYSFTPWLAENLDRLSNVLGMPLELVGQEVSVETFSADILARNPQDNSRVLIENQLEVADHTHLGQILTYLAGLETHTVIWIAADFREAHLSALKWLNENTVAPFAFFAVKVKAVRIGESPIAPMFEVMSKPNQWERRLHAIAQDSSSLSSLGQFRMEFWTHYVNRFPDEQQAWSRPVVPVHAGESSRIWGWQSRFIWLRKKSDFLFGVYAVLQNRTFITCLLPMRIVWRK